MDAWDESKRFRKRSISCPVKKLWVWLEEHRNNNLRHQNCGQNNLEGCFGVVFTCYFIQKLHCWGFMTWVWVVTKGFGTWVFSVSWHKEPTNSGLASFPWLWLTRLAAEAACEPTPDSGPAEHLCCSARRGEELVVWGGDEKEETREEAWGVENVAEECKIRLLIMVWRWWLWWESWSRRRRWRRSQLEMGKINRVKERGKLLYWHFMMWSLLIKSD